MTEPLVYLNGRMLPASEARLNVYHAGVVLGDTVAGVRRTALVFIHWTSFTSGHHGQGLGSLAPHILTGIP